MGYQQTTHYMYIFQEISCLGKKVIKILVKVGARIPLPSFPSFALRIVISLRPFKRSGGSLRLRLGIFHSKNSSVQWWKGNSKAYHNSLAEKSEMFSPKLNEEYRGLLDKTGLRFRPNHDLHFRL